LHLEEGGRGKTLQGGVRVVRKEVEGITFTDKNEERKNLVVLSTCGVQAEQPRTHLLEGGFTNYRKGTFTTGGNLSTKNKG